ncbi:MAG TPA: efflux RND transporter periplasmic adaptor subunit [Thermoanaerobaculia bacterium]|nr:efflux RND transporter periplasmic adaptor subunit [Thermoanaerobaculia bacterium]
MGDVGETGRAAEAESAALAELARCESVAQKAAWAARWCARLSGADESLVFGIDAPSGGWIALGASGSGAGKSLRRVIPRDAGVVREATRSRTPCVRRRDDASFDTDPLAPLLPEGPGVVLVVPLLLDKDAAGAAVLSYRQEPAGGRLARLEAFLPVAAAALDRAQAAERKTAGQLFAIERLTSLYDVTKAFGSTIDLGELSALIARKAADFAVAEVASLWLLDSEAGEVSLAATAVNGNYEVANPPESVGGSLVGDVLADRAIVAKNALADDDPLRNADPSYEVRSVLAVPLVENDAPIGVLAAVNKRGRRPEFTAGDEELLADVARQAVAALRNAQQYEAEKKVEELDALLAVSREITSTLDLDKVMRTIVNATSALIRYDRCAIAILQRGKLRIGAVSGAAEVDRKDASVRRSEALLEWVFFGGTNVAVTRHEDDTISSDRPETEEKFRTFFDESGRNAFYGVLLEDDEGKLGVLGFEATEPLEFDSETRDLLQILVNQATVAVRNAQLYEQVPLPGFLRPLAERTRKLRQQPGGRARRWALGSAAALLLLAVLPWNVRVSGPARVVPARRIPVTTAVEGVVESVAHREGDAVAAGAVVATLRDDAYRAAAAEARAAEQIAEAEVSRHRAEGNVSALFQAVARRDEMRARAALAGEKLRQTSLRAPEAGVVLTPRLEERVGQLLPAGAEFAVLADTSAVLAEVAVPERDAALLATGQKVDVKVNSYPYRTFPGTVVRLGAAVREEGEQRFMIAEARVENADGLLRPGMLGRAKVSTGAQRLLRVLLRGPARWLWSRLWPLLP